MNAKRMASLARQMSGLWAEFADALDEQPQKRSRKVAPPEPKAQPSTGAVEKMGRAMRRAGVAA